MQRKEATSLYKDNWDKEFTDMEALWNRIKNLSENGSYSLCLYIDSKKKYDEVTSILIKNGYEVEEYNGGNNNILEVNWG